MAESGRAESFRARLRAGEPLIGSFVKTPSHAVVEVMALAGFDFVVLDAEHAPFDRDALDRCLLAARAACLPALVRLCDREPATALDALDLGAAGVLAPHVCSVDDARRVHAACRYANGSRGFSNSPRAGDYGGIGMAELVARADDQTAVLCQIEDREAVERVEDIATFDGIDCLFIGRADLALSYGVFDPREREVDQAVARICAAGLSAGRAVGLFVSDLNELARWRDCGVTLFVVGSDQSLMRAGGARLVHQFHG